MICTEREHENGRYHPTGGSSHIQPKTSAKDLSWSGLMETGHMIHLYRPDFLVEAILEVMSRARQAS